MKIYAVMCAALSAGQLWGAVNSLEITERSGAMALTEPTSPNVAFGTKWLDYDNDGWLDLMITNGHVQDNITEIDKSTTYRQPTQLFHIRNA